MKVMKFRFFFVFILIPLFTSAQENCRVLLSELDSVYSGDCKNGLAHGNGQAWGKFHYSGRFVKGLPNGHGKAVYPDGITYVGSWKKGLKHGKGTLSYTDKGEKIEKTYIWSKGEKGKEVLPPSYKVITKRNINRLRIYTQGGGKAVWFVPKSVGGADTEIEDFRVIGSSGIETQGNSRIGYEDIIFPFKGTVKYYTWNKMRTSRFEVYLEIEILEPGNWIVEIQN